MFTFQVGFKGKFEPVNLFGMPSDSAIESVIFSDTNRNHRVFEKVSHRTLVIFIWGSPRRRIYCHENCFLINSSSYFETGSRRLYRIMRHLRNMRSLVTSILPLTLEQLECFIQMTRYRAVDSYRKVSVVAECSRLQYLIDLNVDLTQFYDCTGSVIYHKAHSVWGGFYVNSEFCRLPTSDAHIHCTFCISKYCWLAVDNLETPSDLLCKVVRLSFVEQRSSERIVLH